MGGSIARRFGTVVGCGALRVCSLALVVACVPGPAPVGARYTGAGAPSPAPAQPPLQPPWAGPRFDGTYTLGSGTLTLQQLPDGRLVGSAVDTNLRLDFDGTVQNGQLVGTVSMGAQRAPFTAILQEPYLDVTANGQTTRFVRAQGAPPYAPPVAQGPSAQPPVAAPPPGREPMPPPLATGSEPRGAVFTDEIDGWTGKAPAGWTALSMRVVEDPTKQTKIVVRFFRGLNLQSGYDRFHKEIPHAEQVGAIRQNESLSAGHVLTVEFAEPRGDRWRVHWIQGRDGVLEVVGVTNAAELDRMRPVIDGVARSMLLVNPVRGKTELAGRCYAHVRSSFGSFVERRLGLDANGNARWGGFVNTNVTYETHGGKYLGETNDLIVADPDQGVFAIKGDKLIVHWNDGRISTWTIRWNNGRVGMLMQDGDAFVACS